MWLPLQPLLIKVFLIVFEFLSWGTYTRGIGSGGEEVLFVETQVELVLEGEVAEVVTVITVKQVDVQLRKGVQ